MIDKGNNLVKRLQPLIGKNTTNIDDQDTITKNEFDIYFESCYNLIKNTFGSTSSEIETFQSSIDEYNKKQEREIYNNPNHDVFKMYMAKTKIIIGVLTQLKPASKENHKVRNLGLGSLIVMGVLIPIVLIFLTPVIDDINPLNPDSKSIIPTVIITGPESAQVGSIVKFYGHDSFVPNGGSIKNYIWYVNNIEQSNEPFLEFQVVENKNYKIVLNIEDDQGRTNQDDKILSATSSDIDNSTLIDNNDSGKNTLYPIQCHEGFETINGECIPITNPGKCDEGTKLIGEKCVPLFEFFNGPKLYKSIDDSPFKELKDNPNTKYWEFEDFKEGSITLKGIQITPPPSIVKHLSVDGDDFINGNDGVGGSIHVISTGIKMDFIKGALGELPSHVGFVITNHDARDGSIPNFTLRAFDINDKQIMEDIPGIVSGHENHSTIDDHFYGIFYQNGIKSIELISNVNADINLDHIQYGR